MASVWFDGIDDLNTIAVELANKRARVGAQGARVLRRSAARVEAIAKGFAPEDTGLMKNSIGVDVEADGRFGALEAVIGPTVSYAPYVEFGTSRMAPRAFMGPALDRVGPDFAAACEKVADPLD